MTNLQCAGYQMRDKTYADIATEIREWKEIYSELRKKGIECISLGKNDKGEEIKQENKCFYNCRSNETAVLKHLQQSKM